MDCCVIPLKHGRLSLVQTTDFFYPLVEDPYMMVRPPSESIEIEFSYLSCSSSNSPPVFSSRVG